MSMYETFFDMKNKPFVRDIEPEFLYESSAMKSAMERLRFAADNELFVVVTADAGCGKSTLIRRFNESLPKDKYKLLYLSDSKLTPRWLYTYLLDQLGLEASFYRGDAKKLLQNQIAVIRNKEHRKVVCVLDEAHLLEKETLEEFRFLLNSNFDSESQMALILVGQTELWDTKLRYQRYAAIRQRIDINCILPHLDQAETISYINSNLRYAGCDHNLFTEAAEQLIFKITTGIPRMINRVCDNCLMYAAQQNQKIVDDHMVNFVAEHEMLTSSVENPEGN